MRLLLRFELRRAWNGLRRLGKSPGRLVVALLVWSLAACGIVMQLVMALVDLPTGHTTPLIHVAGPTPERLAAGLFGLLLYLTWHFLDQAFRDGLLAFDAADVDFLFPAPISRRAVLAWKLAKDYLAVAGVVLLVTVFASPHVRLLDGDLRLLLTRGVPGLWLYLVTLLNVGHLLNLWRTFHGDRWRQAPALWRAGFGGALLLLLVLAHANRATAGFAGWSAGLVAVLRSGLGRAVLLPLVTAWEALVSPLDGGPPGLGVRLVLLAALALGSLLLLLARRENIYEPSLGRSFYGTRLRQAMRGGDRQAIRALLMERRSRQAVRARLAPLGRGAGAMLWRSFVCTFTNPLRTMLMYAMLAIGMPLLLVTAALQSGTSHLLPMSPLFSIYIAYVGGTATFRMEQTELRRADLLKPLPLPAWQIVLAQLLPTTLTWATFLLLGVAVLRWSSPLVDVRVAVAVACLLPPLLLLLGLLNVSVALAFPAAQDQAQNVVANLVLLLLSALVLGPGLVLGAVLAWLGWSGVAIGGACGAWYLLCAAVALAVAHRLFRKFEAVEL